MKTLITTLILVSAQAWGNTCNHLREQTSTEYFNSVYIRQNYGSPNWADLCNELNDERGVAECHQEAKLWEEWYRCDQKLVVVRSFQCEVSPIHSTDGVIGTVSFDILKNQAMRLRHTYEGFDFIYEDEFENGKAYSKVNSSKSKITFAHDGEHYGWLASFDGGKTYQGKAIIAEDSTVYLECK